MSNNAINETNEFVKRTLIDPRDEAKRPSKANSKKELKETLNWTSSAETVAPDAPV